ncbi:MAG: DUF222 domain-containing protein, partial [Candidatus Rokubacteria bacterium]|nr:DUF222 domain-containing protein [Candidatus Rokubacteria bacterium]
RLGDEIAELSAHLEAATARLLDLIRAFDARGGWSNGFRSCAAWLSWRIGLDLGAAREKVRVARALGTLPKLAQALARGELSYATVRALTRVAAPGVRREPGRDAARRRWADRRGGRAHADDPAGVTARAAAPGSRLSVPGMHRAVRAGSPHPALGRRRPDDAVEPRAAVSTAPPRRARRRVSSGATAGRRA